MAANIALSSCFVIWLGRLFSIVEFRKDFASDENVPCAEKRVQRLEDIVNRSIVKVALVVSQELHVPQKLLAIDLVEVAQVVLRCEVKKESKSIVVGSQRLLALGHTRK